MITLYESYTWAIHIRTIHVCHQSNTHLLIPLKKNLRILPFLEISKTNGKRFIFLLISNAVACQSRTKQVSVLFTTCLIHWQPDCLIAWKNVSSTIVVLYILFYLYVHPSLVRSFALSFLYYVCCACVHSIRFPVVTI